MKIFFAKKLVLVHVSSLYPVSPLYAYPYAAWLKVAGTAVAQVFERESHCSNWEFASSPCSRCTRLNQLWNNCITSNRNLIFSPLCANNQASPRSLWGVWTLDVNGGLFLPYKIFVAVYF